MSAKIKACISMKGNAWFCASNFDTKAKKKIICSIFNVNLDKDQGTRFNFSISELSLLKRLMVKDGLYYFSLTLRRSRFHIASLFQSWNNKNFEGYFDNFQGGHLIAEGGDKIF